MNKLVLDNVCFSFESKKSEKLSGGKDKSSQTIKNFSLEVEEGSFTTLLGPSGCGKTTLFRLISGFLEPLSGRILIDGKDQKGIEVNERKVGLVFQDYALFPHMTVKQNILYGLKIQRKKEPKSTLDEIVRNAASDLAIENLLSRYPSQLSGGQQQRVSLARALVLKPEILLMDEPLSSLDTKLRAKVRDELKEIQQKVGITTVYVTHDQEEALSLSTKIAVINKGSLLQEGTPCEIYFEPEDIFTADFVGKANFFEKDGRTYLIRPEWFGISEKNFAQDAEPKGVFGGSLRGRILSSSFLGEKTRFLIKLDESGKIITADFDTLFSKDLKEGEPVSLKVRNFFEMKTR